MQTEQPESITDADMEDVSEWAWRLANKIVMGRYGVGSTAVLIDRALSAHTRDPQGLVEANEKLRDDVRRLATEEVVAQCEGCAAPLLSGDDYVSSEDCSGCWAAMSDLPSKRERPCYAYRVGKPDARAALAAWESGR